jgi:hypothetical protein
VRVVGSGSYQDGFGRYPDTGFTQFVLQPEPTNEHDPQAVQVLHEGRLIGYLSAVLAESYQPILMQIISLGYEAHVAGEIEHRVAYLDNEGEEVRHYGAYLYLAWHGELGDWSRGLRAVN